MSIIFAFPTRPFGVYEQDPLVFLAPLDPLWEQALFLAPLDPLWEQALLSAPFDLLWEQAFVSGLPLALNKWESGGLLSSLVAFGFKLASLPLFNGLLFVWGRSVPCLSSAYLGWSWAPTESINVIMF